MRIICLTNFNNFVGNLLIDTCMRNDITIEAIIAVGDKPHFDVLRNYWEYTDFFESLNLVDLEKYHIPVYIVKELNSKNTEKLLKKLKPDLLLQGGVGIIEKAIIDIPTIGILNSHPGDLPKYRGCMAVEWSIFNNDPLSATCHFIDEGIDSGPIVYKENMSISRDMDYYSVRRKSYVHEVNVMIKGIQRILNGFRSEDAEKQNGDYYNKPMNSNQLEEVKKILKENRYGHYLK